MSQRFIQNPWLSDVISTTDATNTVSAAASFVVPSGSAGFCLVNGVLRNTATGASAWFQAARGFKNPSGTFGFTSALLALAGTLSVGTVLPLGDAALLTAFFDFVSSGTTIQPRVTGIAATNIEWLIDASYRIT